MGKIGTRDSYMLRYFKKLLNSAQRLLLFVGFGLLLTVSAFAGEVKWLAVGELHDWFHSAGCEIEVGRRHLISDQQDGLQWPAQFIYQDVKAAKALWIGCRNFDDPVAGKVYDYKVVHVGPRVLDESNEFMTEKFELWGKQDHPLVYVDGLPASKLTYMETVDYVDPDLPADRILYNVVHTSMGITMTRKVYAFINKHHNNYFIYEYVFKNDGIIDLKGTKKEQTLQDVVIFYQYRYAPTKEACAYGNYWLPQSATWGHSTMNDVIYTHPTTGEPFRALISWLGKHSKWSGPGDNIGAPDYLKDGHLGASQFVGVLDLHADKSPNDPSDDPAQPTTTKEVGSDEPWTSGNSQYNASKMAQEYAVMTAGRPAQSHAQRVGDGYADLYGGTPGGYSQAQGFGPYTLKPGDSIYIAYVEAVAGLSRKKDYEIGAKWLADPKNYNSTKDQLVLTGRDSLIKTFERAKANYESDFDIPEAPPAPEQFIVRSGGDRIFLEWADNTDGWVGKNRGNKMVGYRVYRAIHTPDTTYEKIFECGPGTDHPEIVHEFQDKTARRGFNYYYYVATFDDGSSEDGVLESSKYFTMTTEPAFLRRPPSRNLDDIRIVPNPYNIKARDWQFGVSAPDRILFVNLPPFCDIKIYTERGDLIKTIHHDDGSGDEPWNSITDSRQVIVSGIYLVYFQVTQDYIDEDTGKVIFKKGDSIIKKLAVIR